MKFKPQDESRLATLSDEGLIAYLVAARDAGVDDQVRLATEILLGRRYPTILAMVLRKVPEHDAEDVAMNAMVSALRKFTFEGTSIGEFASALKTIVKRRIADYHRKAEKAIKTVVIPDSGEEGSHAGEPAVESEVDDVAIREIREVALAELSDLHRGIVRLRLTGMPSKEVAAIASRSPKNGSDEMTPTNVDKIFSRFCASLRESFEDEGSE